MIETTSSIEATKPKLQQVLYILYPTKFSLYKIKTLINFNNEINTIWLNFMEKFGFYIRKTNVNT